ncbi:MAG: hypothetical protein GEU75_13770 [Dehalococcoidia bacterium]|nr:hypothetical protein [Dehalococcoidia bacterium]
MKLRKQTPAKALILAATIGLLAALFGLIRSAPRIEAESTPSSEGSAVNYDRFFAPSAGSAPSPATAPHTRTQAS